MQCSRIAAGRSPPSPRRRGDEEICSLIAANLTERLLRGAASTIISLCVAAAASAGDNAVPAAISREELIATAVAGIEHNDELLGMVQAEIEDELLQPGVPETKRFTHKGRCGENYDVCSGTEESRECWSKSGMVPVFSDANCTNQSGFTTNPKLNIAQCPTTFGGCD